MRAERKDATRQRRLAIDRKATISVIGAGRLGTALALALTARGYSIEAVVTRNLYHARRAAKLIKPRPHALSATQLDRLPASDLIFITTPDDAIPETAARLASSLKNGHRPGRTALHASGALSSEILRDLRRVNFRIGSMHPLLSVSDPVAGAENLREAFYCIEGERHAVRVARAIVRDLGGQSFSISTGDKALYHAAAVMASGHAIALFDLAMEMVQRCGLTESRARAVLLPLIRSTLENLATREPARALTGTFARADTATVRRHLAALRSQHLLEALAAYRLLGLHSLHLAEENGLDPGALKEIALTLAAGEKRKGTGGRSDK